MEANRYGSSGASVAATFSVQCAHNAARQRAPPPPQDKVDCGVRETYPDKSEQALEAITTLIQQVLGGWTHLQEAVVQSTRAHLHNTASPQLSFVSEDWKSAEVNIIITALVHLLFEFQVKFGLYAHAWVTVFLAVTSQKNGECVVYHKRLSLWETQRAWSIIYVPLQVNRFQISILLIIQYNIYNSVPEILFSRIWSST